MNKYFLYIAPRFTKNYFMPVSTFININYPTVFIAGIAYFFLGIIWYSPRNYMSAWEKLNLIKPGEFTDRLLLFIIALLTTLSSALLIAFFITLVDCNSVISGMWISLIAMLIVLSGSIAVSYLFGDRRIKLYFIDAGYHLIGFMTMGVLLSFWR